MRNNRNLRCNLSLFVLLTWCVYSLTMPLQATAQSMEELMSGYGGGMGSAMKPISPAARSPRPRFSLSGDSAVSNFKNDTPNNIRFNIEVSATGAVVKPGTYRIPVLSRLTDALGAASGALPEGSLRTIVVNAATTGKSTTYDLNRFFMRGDLSQNPYIQEGDSIFVNFKTKAVKVYGPVRNQGEYDLTVEKTYGQFIDFLGGYTTGFDPSGEFSVLRVGEGKTGVMRYKMAQIQNLELKNGDVIMVPHLSRSHVQYNLFINDLPGESVQYPELEKRVYVVGGVAAPGAIDYYPHLTARDYINLAGGLRPLAIRNSVQIVPRAGKPMKLAYDQTPNYNLNPGEVIDIRERLIPPQFWISLFVTISSVALSAVAILKK